MLLGQIVKDNVVPVTDLYSPGRGTVKNAGNSSVAEAVRRLGIERGCLRPRSRQQRQAIGSRRSHGATIKTASFRQLAPGHSRVHFLPTSNPI
jgi:hypothetical protein